MNKIWWARPACAALVLAAVASGCAYWGGSRAGKPSEAAARLSDEAATLAPIANEEDFLEAKFLYQALDEGSEEQARLRRKMVEYLLGPLATLDAQRLRRDPSMLGSDDDFDRLHDSCATPWISSRRLCSGVPKAWLCPIASGAYWDRRPVWSWAPTRRAATSFP